MPVSIASPWVDDLSQLSGRMDIMADGTNGTYGTLWCQFWRWLPCWEVSYQIHLSAQTTMLLQGEVVENSKAEGLSYLGNEAQRGILQMRDFLEIFLGSISECWSALPASRSSSSNVHSGCGWEGEMELSRNVGDQLPTFRGQVEVFKTMFEGGSFNEIFQVILGKNLIRISGP